MNSDPGSVSQTSLTGTAFSPRRAASWWSTIEDLLWPEKRARDMIRRRADDLAEAGVDTVIQFGFHCRFDFAWYFGAIHGLFNEIAETLHERGIRFLDHYSCNVIARPNSREELVKYHTCNRHHVALNPDPVAAETAGYAGFRFNDLRDIDVATGKASYCGYQAEMFCHNNPGFLAMHEAYLKRLMAEVPLDGAHVDDMVFYGHFRSCGCPCCRARFQREYGRTLPPISDRTFWGDTSLHPQMWGNYANPAFRQWVRLRYRIIADHVAMIRRTLGPDRVYLTCCCSSGPSYLNGVAESYENVLPSCDWVMMENCGLDAGTTQWGRAESDALLQKAIAESKSPQPAPALALSYTVYEDGARLGWALARFWGVTNWVSSLTPGLAEDPGDTPDEATLVGSLNRWERPFDNLGTGKDVVEVRLAFLRAAKENGWADDKGRDHWERVKRWSQAFLHKNIGYRFVLTDELSDSRRLLAETTPLILDGCSHLTADQRRAIREFLGQGGKAWIVPPLGPFDADGNPCSPNLIEEIRGDPSLAGSLILIDTEQGPQFLSDPRNRNALVPRINRVCDSDGWALRLRRHGDCLVMHILNRALEGREHATIVARGSDRKILTTIVSKATDSVLTCDLDLTGLPIRPWNNPVLYSPELSAPRPVQLNDDESHRRRLTIDMASIRIYGMITERRNT